MSCWQFCPSLDLTGQKRRPALVVSNETRSGDDVIVVFLTTHQGQPCLPMEVLLRDDDPDFPQLRLKRSSVIKADKLFTIHKNLILGKIGSLTPRLLEQVEQCLRLALAL